MDETKKYLDVDVDNDAIAPIVGNKTKKKRTAQVSKARKPNAWIKLIQKVKSDNPGITHKQAMTAASKIKKYHGSSENALGSGLSFKDIMSGLKNVGKKIFSKGKDIVSSKEFQDAAKDIGKEVITKATPHLKEAGKELFERGKQKVTGVARETPGKSFIDIGKSATKDVGKELAHQGVHQAHKLMSENIPKEGHALLTKISTEVHKKIDERVGKGLVAKYLHECDDCYNKSGKGMRYEPAQGWNNYMGAGGGFIPLLGALAPTVIPLATNLLGSLFGKLFGKGMRGGIIGENAYSKRGYGSTSGDYSSNELGVYPREKRGGHILNVQQSDPPLNNIFAKHSNLWQFSTQPGLMGITETPTNSFYSPIDHFDENVGIWELANDIDEYINSAPTFEDGITSIAPMSLSINPTQLSGMPKHSTLGSTIKVIKNEKSTSTDSYGSGNANSDGSFVYSPGISLSRLANAYTNSNRYGNGMIGSMSVHAGRGGDVTRFGRGILPTENVVTGDPIGVSERGRGMQQGGRGRNYRQPLIRGSNISSWQ